MYVRSSNHVACVVCHFSVTVMSLLLLVVDKGVLFTEVTHSLETLKCILSTGSPLKPESFDYVYRDVKENLLLGSITGVWAIKWVVITCGGGGQGCQAGSEISGICLFHERATTCLCFGLKTGLNLIIYMFICMYM